MAKKFVVGESVRVKDSLNGESRYYSFRGRTGKIISDNYSSVDIKLDDGFILRSVGYSVLEIRVGSSKEKLIASLNEKKEEIVEIEEKIRFLEETGQDELNLNEFKAYRTLTVMEQQELTKAEKAKMIAELLK